MKSVNDQAYKRFLERLRAARKGAHVSQEQLADRLDKHQTYVSKVETGERFLNLLEYLLWAREIGADPMELLKDLAEEVAGRRPPKRRTLLNRQTG